MVAVTVATRGKNRVSSHAPCVHTTSPATSVELHQEGEGRVKRHRMLHQPYIHSTQASRYLVRSKRRKPQCVRRQRGRLIRFGLPRCAASRSARDMADPCLQRTQYVRDGCRAPRYKSASGSSVCNRSSDCALTGRATCNRSVHQFHPFHSVSIWVSTLLPSSPLLRCSVPLAWVSLRRRQRMVCYRFCTCARVQKACMLTTLYACWRCAVTTPFHDC
jgi:hypothetical protein